MAEALRHRGGVLEQASPAPEVRLGARRHEARDDASAAAVARSGAIIVFDGRLDNRDEIIPAFPDPISAAALPDCALAALVYDQKGDDFVSRLNGDFAVAVFDAGRRRLLLARDAVGVPPCYYFSSPALFAFATDIRALLAHAAIPARPDDTVLAEFVASRLHRQPADGTTFFQGIRAVLPAHIVSVTGDGCRSRRYWDFFQAGAAECSPSEAPEAFRHHFTLAVRRRLRTAHRAAVSVSGGLDSSAILCAGLAAGRDQGGPAITGFHYQGGDSLDTSDAPFVDELERTRRVCLVRVGAKPGLLDDCRGVVTHAEAPMLRGSWNTLRRLLGAVRNHGSDVLLTGHWGDQVLFDQAYLVDLAGAGHFGELRRHLDEYARWLPDADGREFRSFFASDLAREWLPGGVHRLLGRARARWRRPSADTWYREAFLGLAPGRRFHGAEPDPAVSAHGRSLYREVRSRYNLLCLEWNNKIAAMFGVDMAFPFLDRDLLVFLMGVPGAVLNASGVPKAILRRSMRGIVPDAILDRRSKADFSTLVNDGMKSDLPALVRSFGSARAVEMGYVDPVALRKGLRSAADGLQSSTCAASWRLADLFAFELWLREFFGHTRPGTGAPMRRDRPGSGATKLTSAGGSSGKKPYRAPRLTTYGTLAKLTKLKGRDKSDGSGEPATRK